ncbi:hypothetical protein IKZ40_06635 [bacterium]|nr:hypothetical protein [bacterium]
MKKLIFLTCFLALLANCLFAANEAIKPDGEGTADSPYVLTRIENLVWMGDNIKTCKKSVFCLGNDIDASETANWEKQFVPIGTTKETWGQNYNFEGTLDGKNFAIKNLHVRDNGMFLQIFGAKIQNLYLDNYRGKQGGLAPMCAASTITNVHVSGLILGSGFAGGICGYVDNSAIVNCSFMGLISTIREGSFGGIVGQAEYSDISYCKSSGYIYSSGDTDNVGGICGIVSGNDYYDKYYPRVRYCIADMKIKAKGNVGGIVALNQIENVEQYPGEDPYVLNNLGLIDNYSLCIADVSSAVCVGGICAVFDKNTAASINNFYDKTGINGTVFGTGLSSERMKNKSSYTRWDFNKIWTIQEGETTPYWAICNNKPYRVACISNFDNTLNVAPGEKSYAFNENATINATAPEDGEFLGFKGDIDGTETSVSVDLKKDLVVEGVFAKHIGTAEDFLKIGRNNDYPKDGYYIQTSNIDMSGIEYPVPTDFLGVYDGNNRIIRNIKFCKYAIELGLFSNIRYAKICNLGIINVEKNIGELYNQNFGFLVGGDTSYSEISNCYITSDVFLNNTSYAGGICNGFGYSKMSKCEFRGTILYSPTSFGGLVNTAIQSTFEECSVEIFNGLNARKNTISGLTFGGQKSFFANCYVKGDCLDYAFAASIPRVEPEFTFSNCYVLAENPNVQVDANIINCYFNSNCVEQVEGVTGFVSPEEMKQQETYVGWDFDEIWDIDEGVGTPYFRYVVPEPVGMLALFLLALVAVRKR